VCEDWGTIDELLRLMYTLFLLACMVRVVRIPVRCYKLKGAMLDAAPVS